MGVRFKIPFSDLRVTDKKSRKDLLSSVEAVLRHGRFILGPEVNRLEERIASYCGRKYGIGVNSGTDALFLALRSLGIGPGDEVITTALSWIATANAITLSGATPVFGDIRDDLNLDPESVRGLLTRRTRALVLVHYTGKICDMKAFSGIARKHKLFLIEDASQAFGARRHNRVAGSFGDLACFSMNPMKPFAACGEAGMIVTDKRGIRDKLRALRYNGMVNREVCIEPSLNGRLDTLQAAILLKRFDHIESIIDKRREIAQGYHVKLDGIVGVPAESPAERDIYYVYTIRTPWRDKLKVFLESRGIEAKVRDPYLLPEQPAYRAKARGRYFNATRLVKQLLCLPAHEKMSYHQVDTVASAIRDFFLKEKR